MQANFRRSNAKQTRQSESQSNIITLLDMKHEMVPGTRLDKCALVQLIGTTLLLRQVKIAIRSTIQNESATRPTNAGVPR